MMEYSQKNPSNSLQFHEFLKISAEKSDFVHVATATASARKMKNISMLPKYQRPHDTDQEL